ncbi:hypothetical protein Ciccas_001263, partial [Cichlidogyrus casuarinus]
MKTFVDYFRLDNTQKMETYANEALEDLENVYQEVSGLQISGLEQEVERLKLDLTKDPEVNWKITECGIREMELESILERMIYLAQIIACFKLCPGIQKALLEELLLKIEAVGDALDQIKKDLPPDVIERAKERHDSGLLLASTDPEAQDSGSSHFMGSHISPDSGRLSSPQLVEGISAKEERKKSILLLDVLGEHTCCYSLCQCADESKSAISQSQIFSDGSFIRLTEAPEKESLQICVVDSGTFYQAQTYCNETIQTDLLRYDVIGSVTTNSATSVDFLSEEPGLNKGEENLVESPIFETVEELDSLDEELSEATISTTEDYTLMVHQNLLVEGFVNKKKRKSVFGKISKAIKNKLGSSRGSKLSHSQPEVEGGSPKGTTTTEMVYENISTTPIHDTLSNLEIENQSSLIPSVIPQMLLETATKAEELKVLEIKDSSLALESLYENVQDSNQPIVVDKDDQKLLNADEVGPSKATKKRNQKKRRGRDERLVNTSTKETLEEIFSDQENLELIPSPVTLSLAPGIISQSDFEIITELNHPIVIDGSGEEHDNYQTNDEPKRKTEEILKSEEERDLIEHSADSVMENSGLLKKATIDTQNRPLTEESLDFVPKSHELVGEEEAAIPKSQKKKIKKKKLEKGSADPLEEGTVEEINFHEDTLEDLDSIQTLVLTPHVISISESQKEQMEIISEPPLQVMEGNETSTSLEEKRGPAKSQEPVLSRAQKKRHKKKRKEGEKETSGLAKEIEVSAETSKGLEPSNKFEVNPVSALETEATKEAFSDEREVMPLTEESSIKKIEPVQCFNLAPEISPRIPSQNVVSSISQVVEKQMQLSTGSKSENSAISKEKNERSEAKSFLKEEPSIIADAYETAEDLDEIQTVDLVAEIVPASITESLTDKNSLTILEASEESSQADSMKNQEAMYPGIVRGAPVQTSSEEQGSGKSEEVVHSKRQKKRNKTKRKQSKVSPQVETMNEIQQEKHGELKHSEGMEEETVESPENCLSSSKIVPDTVALTEKIGKEEGTVTEDSQKSINASKKRNENTETKQSESAERAAEDGKLVDHSCVEKAEPKSATTETTKKDRSLNQKVIPGSVVEVETESEKNTTDITPRDETTNHEAIPEPPVEERAESKKTMTDFRPKDGSVGQEVIPKHSVKEKAESETDITVITPPDDSVDQGGILERPVEEEAKSEKAMTNIRSKDESVNQGVILESPVEIETKNESDTTEITPADDSVDQGSFPELPLRCKTELETEITEFTSTDDSRDQAIPQSLVKEEAESDTDITAPTDESVDQAAIPESPVHEKAQSDTNTTEITLTYDSVNRGASPEPPLKEEAESAKDTTEISSPDDSVYQSAIPEYPVKKEIQPARDTTEIIPPDNSVNQCAISKSLSKEEADSETDSTVINPSDDSGDQGAVLEPPVEAVAESERAMKELRSKDGSAIQEVIPASPVKGETESVQETIEISPADDSLDQGAIPKRPVGEETKSETKINEITPPDDSVNRGSSPDIPVKGEAKFEEDTTEITSADDYVDQGAIPERPLKKETKSARDITKITPPDDSVNQGAISEISSMEGADSEIDTTVITPPNDSVDRGAFSGRPVKEEAELETDHPTFSSADDSEDQAIPESLDKEENDSVSDPTKITPTNEPVDHRAIAVDEKVQSDTETIEITLPGAS